MRPTATLVTAFVLLLISVPSAGSAPRSSWLESSGDELTAEGRLLRSFEKLLRRSFPGHRIVSASLIATTGALNFACVGDCSPNSKYVRYRFTFSNPQNETLHVSKKGHFRGTFGNYRRQVLIRGKSIACDPNEKTFLVQQIDAVSFTLACSRPPAGVKPSG